MGRGVLGALTAALLLGGVPLAGCSSGSPVEQPVRYSHKIHVQDVEMDCVDCHQYAKTLARATIPNIEVCGGCHGEEPLGDSPYEKQVMEYVNSGKKIPWKKIYRVPSYVYFSHRRHTVLAKIECTTCHGDMASRTEPLTRPLVRISMTTCLDCHEKRGVDNDCTRCHR